MSITKKDIARNIKLSTSSNNKSCNDLVSSFFDILKSQSLNHDIKISNFGTFKKKITPERIGRNPKTGEEHVITERVKLNLVVSNKVKETLN